MYTHTHVSTYIHTHTHTYTHIQTHTDIYRDTRTHTLMKTRRQHAPMGWQSCRQAHVCTCPHARTHTCARYRVSLGLPQAQLEEPRETSVWERTQAPDCPLHGRLREEERGEKHGPPAADAGRRSLESQPDLPAKWRRDSNPSSKGQAGARTIWSQALLLEEILQQAQWSPHDLRNQH